MLRWIFTLAVAVLVYYALTKIWPRKEDCVHACKPYRVKQYMKEAKICVCH